MKNKRIKSLLSIVLCITLVLSNIAFADTAGAQPAKYADIAGNKYEIQIREWIANGFIKGYPDGDFKPQNQITRSEFMALVNRAYGFTDTMDIKYSDITKTEWYYNDAAIAAKAGFMQGSNGKLMPLDNISRQEMAVILSRLTKNEKAAADDAVINNITDKNEIPEWSKAAVSVAMKNKFFDGFVDMAFKPTEKITRLEAVVALDRAFKSMYKAVYTVQGTYGPETGMETLDGDVVVIAPDVILRNITINGNLILRETIGEGNVYLDNVVVKGDTIVKGGGANSIVIKNSTLGRIIVIKEGNTVRIVATGSTTIGTVDVGANAKLEEFELTGAGFNDVIVLDDIPEGANVVFEGNFGDVEIDSPNINVTLQSGTIGSLNLTETAVDTNINLGQQTTVTTMTLNVATNVTGTGTIGTANINVTGTIIEQQPTTVVTAPNVIAQVAGKPVNEPTTPVPSLGGGGGGGNGGGGNTNSAPTAINVEITGEAIVGSTVTGSYTYSDDENNAEGTSTYKWYHGDAATGSDKVAILGANIKTYTVTVDDNGKYLFFDVTPVAVSGTKIGAVVMSAASSKVALRTMTASVNAIDATTVDVTMVLLDGATFTWNGGTPLSSIYNNGKYTLTVPLMKSGVNNTLVVAKSGYNSYTNNGAVWTDVLTYIGSTLSDWMTDRTEPEAWSITDNWIALTTKTEPANNWYAWHGKKAATNNAVTSNWKVETEIELTEELLARDGVRTSMWLNVLNPAGKNIDWAILQFKIDNTNQIKGWQYWNSTNAGSWVDIDGIPTTAGVYKLAIYFENGTITQYINGIKVNEYTIEEEELSSVKEVIFNSYSFGQAYTTKWKAPTVSYVEKFPVGTKFISSIDQLKVAIANQADGQNWIITSGIYDVPQNTTKLRDTNGAVVESGGQAGWYMPITANSLTITGIGNPVITSSTVTSNGSWASQNLITVWGDNVTFKGLTITPKVEENKSIEVVGDKKFTIEDCTFTPNTVVVGADATYGGSLYFNGAGTTGTKTILVKNNIFNYTSIAFDGVAGSNITITGNTFENIAGYAIGNTYWGSAERKTTQYVDVKVNGNNFNNVVEGTKIITARLNQTFILDAANKVNGDPIDKDTFRGHINFNNLAYWIECKDNIVIADNYVFESPYIELDAYVTNETQLKAALSAANDGDTIQVAAGTYELTEQLNITKAVTIEGLGEVILKAVPTSSWSTVNGYKHLLAIYAGTAEDPVTISNIVIDANDKAHAVNTYNNAYGILNDVTINNSKGAGLTVNGSTIIADNLNTNGNDWGAVNVDPGDRVSTESLFTLTGDGVLEDETQIWSDGRYVTGTATVDVIATGYMKYTVAGQTNAFVWKNNALTNAITINNGTTLYPSIQAAINAAITGDTIDLSEGTYNIGESKILINKGINLIGAGMDNTKIIGTVHRFGSGANDIVQPMLLTTSTSGTTLIEGIHFEWKDKASVGNNWYSAISLAGDDVTLNNCKVTTDIPETQYIAIINIGKSGGSMLDEAGVAAERINFTNNIVEGTISIVPSVVGKSLKANVSGNTITAVNMEGIWTYVLNEQDELTFEDNTITGVPAGMFDIKLMEKVGSVNRETDYTADSISSVNNDASVLLQYSTRIVDASYTGVEGKDNKYKTIQAAINSAQDGDTIIVAEGTYSASQFLILEGKSGITIQGAGIDETIFELTASSDGFKVQADNITLRDFTIDTVEGTNKAIYGLRAQGVDNLTVQDVRITNMKKSAFDINGVTDSSFIGLIAENNGGYGISINQSKDVTFSGNTTGNVWGAILVANKLQSSFDNQFTEGINIEDVASTEDVRLNIENYDSIPVITGITFDEESMQPDPIETTSEPGVTKLTYFAIDFVIPLMAAETDLTEYTAALEVVAEADYTAESWIIYQAVVMDNVVTATNTQEEVDAAKEAIIAAQGNLVAVEEPAETDLTEYTAALEAVAEADYTAESWIIYQAVVMDNVVTATNTQEEVDAAKEAIIAAQGNLVAVEEPV